MSGYLALDFGPPRRLLTPRNPLGAADGSLERLAEQLEALGGQPDSPLNRPDLCHEPLGQETS